MADAKFTPGPWDRVDETVFALDETQSCNRFSALVQGGYVAREQGWVAGEKTPPEELRANAHLIAAAPDLYQLAEKAMRWFADNQCAGGLAWEIGEALAKARGEQVSA